MKIRYFDRVTQEEKKEKVYGAFFLNLLYGQGWLRRALSFFLLPLLAYSPFFSSLYGSIQKSRWSRPKVRRFIRKFHIDTQEFLDPVDSFHSFNDFFTRKLNLTYRPIASQKEIAILPADARYLVFPHVNRLQEFFVKGHPFSLEKLLQDKALVEQYQDGALAIARLCPVDYHRFHFPCAGIAEEAREIPGPLFSVNPIALKRHADILSRNKRVITPFKTEQFGTILYIEVGATYVGTIHETFRPYKIYQKGDEKGFFSFGGSCVILLFERGKIAFEPDLLHYSAKGMEVRGLMGQPLGRAH